jgi:hypothetical protein
LFYHSDIAGQFPAGVMAPQCFGVEEHDDDRVSLWLEDLGNAVAQPWSTDDYVLAARHLGRLNGIWLVSESIPSQSWLSRRTLASWVGSPLSDLERWTEAAEDPLIGPHCDPTIGEEAIRLYHRHTSILEALDQLPQTFHHGDAHRGNTVIREEHGEAAETVLYDWAFAGIRAVGEELESFVSAASAFFHIDHRDIDALATAAFQGYVDGLHDVGWSGDPDTVRLGYLGAATLRYTLLPIEVYLLNPETRDWFCGVTGRPLSETLERYMDVRRWGFQQETEVRQLMQHLLPQA